MLNKLLCFFGMHSWQFKHDFGRNKAVTMSSGMSIWMDDIHIQCARCGKFRKAKFADDHNLPEILHET